MFDDFRKESQSSQFSSDEIENLFDAKPKKERGKLKFGSGGRIFGLKAVQRMILSFLLIILACLGGAIVLLLSERIVIF